MSAETYLPEQDIILASSIEYVIIQILHFLSKGHFYYCCLTEMIVIPSKLSRLPNILYFCAFMLHPASPLDPT